MQIICTSLQTDNHASTSSLNFYRTDALSDAQPTVSKHGTMKSERESTAEVEEHAEKLETAMGLARMSDNGMKQAHE